MKWLTSDYQIGWVMHLPQTAIKFLNFYLSRLLTPKLGKIMPFVSSLHTIPEEPVQEDISPGTQVKSSPSVDKKNATQENGRPSNKNQKEHHLEEYTSEGGSISYLDSTCSSFDT